MSENKKSVIHLNNDNFQSIISDKNPVLVDFFATWCGPCQMMAPVLDDIAKNDAKDDFCVAKIDIDENPEIAAKYDVMSIPTFIVFKEEKEIARMMGAMPKEMIIQKVLDTKK